MKLFVIYCRTGCSCCSNENHYRGPYQTREDAQKEIDSYYAPDSKFWPLASQYAKRGHYNIKEIEVETLPDGRQIVNDEHITRDLSVETPMVLEFLGD